MKVIINESQYHQVILNELGNRGKGLLSYISRNYEVMGNSFTPRFGRGEQWFTRNNIADELRHNFNLSPLMATEIVDYYLRSKQIDENNL